MFGDLRMHHNFPTRRRSQRPTHIPITIDFGNRKASMGIPIAEHPSLLIMPAFPPPGILTGLPPSGMWPEAKFHVFQHHWDRETLRTLVVSEGGHGIEVTKNITPAPFVRMLAKIAHGFLVAMRGLGNFNPLLPELILGKNQDIAYLVGGELARLIHAVDGF
jgi:hypothetical protein